MQHQMHLRSHRQPIPDVPDFQYYTAETKKIAFDNIVKLLEIRQTCKPLSTTLTHWQDDISPVYVGSNDDTGYQAFSNIITGGAKKDTVIMIKQAIAKAIKKHNEQKVPNLEKITHLGCKSLAEVIQVPFIFIEHATTKITHYYNGSDEHEPLFIIEKVTKDDYRVIKSFK